MGGCRLEKAQIIVLPATVATGEGWNYEPARPERFGLCFEDGEVTDEVDSWGNIDPGLNIGRQVEVSISIFIKVDRLVQ